MKLTSKTTEEKMKSVKASCGAAPFGEKRTKAWKHYYAADAAHTAKDEAKTIKELDAATQTLA